MLKIALMAFLLCGVASSAQPAALRAGTCGRFSPTVLADSTFGTPSLRPLGAGKYGFAQIVLCFDSNGRPHGSATFISGGQADLFPTQHTEVQFDSGVLNGPFRVREGATILSEGRMRRGKRTGEYVEYRPEDGSVLARSRWLDGVEVGEHQWFDSAGRLTRALQFVEGRCVWRGDDVPSWAAHCLLIECHPSRVREDAEGQFCTNRRGERHGPFVQHFQVALLRGEYHRGAPAGVWTSRDLSDGGLKRWDVDDFIEVTCEAGSRRVVAENSVRCVGATGHADGAFGEWTAWGQAVRGRFRNGFPNGHWLMKSGNASPHIIADFEPVSSWPIRCPRSARLRSDAISWWGGDTWCMRSELTPHGPTASWRGVVQNDGGVSLQWVFSVFDAGIRQDSRSGETSW